METWDVSKFGGLSSLFMQAAKAGKFNSRSVSEMAVIAAQCKVASKGSL